MPRFIKRSSRFTKPSRQWIERGADPGRVRSASAASAARTSPPGRSNRRCPAPGSTHPPSLRAHGEFALPPNSSRFTPCGCAVSQRSRHRLHEHAFRIMRGARSCMLLGEPRHGASADADDERRDGEHHDHLQQGETGGASLHGGSPVADVVLGVFHSIRSEREHVVAARVVLAGVAIGELAPPGSISRRPSSPRPAARASARRWGV
jgi:hypothetical protein